MFVSGDVETLCEKILSIPQHLTNNHVFPNNKKHLKCAHGDLSQEERNKPWLEEGSKVKAYCANIFVADYFVIIRNFLH